MFRLLGVRLHPAVRLLIGAGLITFGVLSSRVGLDVVGGVFVLWTIAGAMGAGSTRETARSSSERHFR